MKRAKKVIALILAVVTIAACSIVPASASHPGYVGDFTDVPTTAWYAQPVKWAVANGITNGRTTTNFCPNENVNFMETCTFLYRVFGSPYISNSEVTQQINRLPVAVRNKLQSWSYKYVAWALRDGIAKANELTANTDTTGRLIVPNQPMTRNYVIAYLYRAEKKMKGSAPNGVLISPKLENYRDRNQAALVVGGDGSAAWRWALSKGLIVGRSDTELACKGTIKRSEIVTILYRYCVTNAYITLAVQQNGKQYAYGGQGPNAFDCAGLIYYVLTSCKLADGMTLGGSCGAQRASVYMTRVTKSTETNALSKLQYGDLIFYKSGASATEWKHVAIYLGKIDMAKAGTEKSQNETIAVFHAKSTSRGVGYSGFSYDANYFGYWEAYRFDPCH